MSSNTSKKVLKLANDGSAITNHCLICGYDNESKLEVGDDCFCCGIDFLNWIGNPTISLIKLERKDWIEEGLPLAIEGDPEAPNPWNEDVMWKQVTENVPEEYWKDDPYYLVYIANKNTSKKVLKLTNHCLICGYDNDGELEIGDDCLCCGIDFLNWIGNPTISLIKLERKDWIEEGFPLAWVDEESPNPWNEDVMWKQVTENVPEEYWKDDEYYLAYIANKK